MCTATLREGSVKKLSASVMLAALLGGCGSSTTTEVPGFTEASDGSQALSTYPENPVAFDTQIQSDQATGIPPEVTNEGPAGNSGVSIDDRHYALDTALGDAWGLFNEVPGEYFNVNFTLSDGSFELSNIAVGDETHRILIPSEASTVIYAELFHPGDIFRFTGFEFDGVPGNRSTKPGTPFFTNAYIGIDFNEDRKVDSIERLKVNQGRISFAGAPPALQIHFEVSLESGQVATGHYTGLINFTDRGGQ